MKKTFRENVSIYGVFSLNRKETSCVENMGFLRAVRKKTTVPQF